MLGKSLLLLLLLLLSQCGLLLDQRLLLLLHCHLLLLPLLLQLLVLVMVLVLGQCLLLMLRLGHRRGACLGRATCCAGRNIRLHRAGGTDRRLVRCCCSNCGVRLACLLMLLCRRS